jgi:hypothetical protein
VARSVTAGTSSPTFHFSLMTNVLIDDSVRACTLAHLGRLHHSRGLLRGSRFGCGEALHLLTPCVTALRFPDNESNMRRRQCSRPELKFFAMRRGMLVSLYRYCNRSKAISVVLYGIYHLLRAAILVRKRSAYGIPRRNKTSVQLKMAPRFSAPSPQPITIAQPATGDDKHQISLPCLRLYRCK